MSDRWDETWHRLREWTTSQAPSERLAAQILSHDGFTGIDPSHPLGGKDGGKDAVCWKNGQKWIMAVHFPRGQKSFRAIKKKFLDDFKGAKANDAEGFAFVTNQELMLAQREELGDASGSIPVEIYHLERITGILDEPAMGGVRKQFLGIDIPQNIPSDQPETKRLWVGGSTLTELITEDQVRSNLSAVVNPIANGEVKCVTKKPAHLPDGTGVYHYVVAEGSPDACVGVDILGGLQNVGSVVIDGESYTVFKSQYPFHADHTDKGIIWKLIYL
jgi:hypothetical protein